MSQFQSVIIINKPIKIVYEAYINSENMFFWTTDLEKFETVKGEFGEIGATALLHYNSNGRKSIFEDKLEYLEPYNKIVSQVSGEGLIAKVTTGFNSIDNKTELKLTWKGKGKNIFISLILYLAKSRIKKVASSDLNKFRDLVEKYGITFKPY